MTHGPGKKLIVNADDFGLSAGINAGIIRAHRDGIVTSTSLMVRWPAAAEAAALAAQNPRLGVGLHIDLGEWEYRDDAWRRLYQVLPQEQGENPDAIAAEVAAQLSRFRQLMGADPTHLDSHQHVHQHEPLRSVVQRLADRMGLPLRHFDPRIRYCGEFYGQSGKGDPYPPGIEVDSLCKVILSLPDGVTEMGCHPGLGADFHSVYATERAREVESLCDPRVREALEKTGVELINFRALMQ